MRLKMDSLAHDLSEALDRAERESRRNRLFGELGNPAVGFRVRIETKEPDGKRSMVADTLSNDRGEYRVGGLAADAYFVSFVPSVEILSASPRASTSSGAASSCR